MVVKMQSSGNKILHGLMLWIYLLSLFISPVYAEEKVPAGSQKPAQQVPAAGVVDTAKPQATTEVEAAPIDPLWQQALQAAEQARADAAKSDAAVNALATTATEMNAAQKKAEQAAGQIDVALKQTATATELAQSQAAEDGKAAMLVAQKLIEASQQTATRLLQRQTDAIKQTEQTLGSTRQASTAAGQASSSAETNKTNQQQQLTDKLGADAKAKQAQSAAAKVHEQAQADLKAKESGLQQAKASLQTAEQKKQTDKQALEQASGLSQQAQAEVGKWQKELEQATASLANAELKLQQLGKMLVETKKSPAETAPVDAGKPTPAPATEAPAKEKTAALAPSTSAPATEAVQASAAAKQAQKAIDQAHSAMEQARSAALQARDSALQSKVSTETALQKVTSEHQKAQAVLPPLTATLEVSTQAEQAASKTLATSQTAYDASVAAAQQAQTDFQQTQQQAQTAAQALTEAQQALALAQKRHEQSLAHQAEMAQSEKLINERLAQLKTELAALQATEKQLQVVATLASGQLKLADEHVAHVKDLVAKMQAGNWTLAALTPEPPAMVALGKQLFFDRRLSGNGSMSCASCHSPMLGWGDGLALGIGHNGQTLKRASPVIINVAYEKLFMWDGRFASLQAQVLGPITSPVEMNAKIEDVIARLKSVKGYAKSFAQLFPKKGVSAETLGLALASFERTLISNTSPFDKWLQGDTTAMPKEAQDGFRVFVDSRKGNCAACHQGGNLTDDGFHNIGLASFAAADADKGRFAIKPVKLMQGAFKTPTLRDINKSAPYFHDGSSATLAQVIEHYRKGGEVKTNLAPEMKELKLTDQEAHSLLVFLNNLSSDSQPFELPVLPM